MRDAILSEVPAEEDELAVLRMSSWKVHEPAVEVLHLDSGLLELGHDEADLVRNRLDGVLCLLHVLGIESTTVPADLPPDRRQPLALSQESLARGDEALHERLDHREGIVRFLLAEEAHTC